MSTIESYGTSGSAPKGSRENPYTYEEYERLNSEGKWTSAYVEGMGIVLPDVYVISSFPGSGILSDFEDDYNDYDLQDASFDFDEGQQGNNSNNNSQSGGNGGQGSGNAGYGNAGNGDGYGNTGWGNNESFNSSDLSLHTEAIVSQAKNFSKEVATVLQNLINGGKIKDANNGEIKGAQWNSTTKTMIVGPNATDANIWHELVHYHQRECDNCMHACREWQAYLLEEIMVNVDSLMDKESYKPYLGLDKTQMKNLRITCYRNNKKPVILESVYNYIISMNYEENVQVFMDYWRKIDQEENPDNPQYSNYYDGYDPDYDWDWDGLLERLGIRVEY